MFVARPTAMAAGRVGCRRLHHMTRKALRSVRGCTKKGLPDADATEAGGGLTERNLLTLELLQLLRKELDRLLKLLELLRHDLQYLLELVQLLRNGLHQLLKQLHVLLLEVLKLLDLLRDNRQHLLRILLRQVGPEPLHAVGREPPSGLLPGIADR